MKHRMLGTTDVQIDRHPLFFKFRVNKRFIVLGIDKPKKVPTRPRPLRHGVGFSFVFYAVDDRIKPLIIRFFKWRFRPTVRFKIFNLRKVDWQLILRNRTHHARSISGLIKLMQNRERLSPKTLTAEQPVTQFVVDRCSARSAVF